MFTVRDYQKKDIPLRVKWFNNEKINQFLSNENQGKTNLEKQTDWFKRYSRDISKKFFTFEYDKKPIWFMGFSNINFTNKNADIFIMIWEDEYLGKGLWETAMKRLIEYWFGELELHKICLWVFDENTRALNLYKKLWFEIEWTLVDDAFFEEKFHNSLLMSIFNR